MTGGNKQRDFISKEDYSSPTVSTKAVLLSCIIYAKYKRCVATIDTPNVFIQKIFKNENEILELLDKAEPKASGTKSSAAPLNLFVVDEDCEKLSK